jgi:N-acetyl-gamma-glutamylphosphate reductase
MRLGLSDHAVPSATRRHFSMNVSRKRFARRAQRASSKGCTPVAAALSARPALPDKGVNRDKSALQPKFGVEGAKKGCATG